MYICLFITGGFLTKREVFSMLLHFKVKFPDRGLNCESTNFITIISEYYNQTRYSDDYKRYERCEKFLSGVDFKILNILSNSMCQLYCF